MQKRNKILLGAGAGVLLALGGLAGLAHADMEGHGPGMACGMHHGHAMMARRLTERYDTNKDGKVTQAEIDKDRQQWFTEFDTDKDGKLSLEEFKQLWIKRNNERMVRAFQFLDRDGNAQVTLEEYKAPVEGLAAARDADGEGRGWRHMMNMGYGMGEGCGAHGDDGPDPQDQPPGDGPDAP